MAEPKTTPADPKAVDRRVIDATTKERPESIEVSERPPMARLFEALGIEQGKKLNEVALTDGRRLSHVEVARTYVVAEKDGVPGDIVLALAEDGTRTVNVVRWQQIVSITKR